MHAPVVVELHGNNGINGTNEFLAIDMTNGEKSVNPLRDEASLKRSGKNAYQPIRDCVSWGQIRASVDFYWSSPLMKCH